MEEKPGAPAEPEKPKEVREKVYFSYQDLHLITVDVTDAVRYIYWLVGDAEYIIAMKEFDYYHYLNYYFTEVEILRNEGASCICDRCTPETEFLSDYDLPVKEIKLQEGKEEHSDKTIKIPVYLVWNLVENCEIGIHGNHEE